MSETVEPGAVPTRASGHPWRATLLKGAMLLAESCLLGGLYGLTLQTAVSTVLGYDGISATKTLCLILAVVTTMGIHVLGHLAEYRDGRVPILGLVAHTLLFAGLVVLLEGIVRGTATPMLGERGAFVVAMLLAGLWFLGLVALWVPRPAYALSLFGAVGVVGLGLWLSNVSGRVFWDATGGMTLDLVEMMLAPFAGAPVIRPSESKIGTDDFTVLVLAPCSGYQGITLITALLAGYLWWFRDIHRFPQSFLLFPIGITLIYLANALRITLLLLVGIWISPEIAIDGFHSQAGWIAFLVVGLGIIWVTLQIPFFTREATLVPAAGPMAEAAVAAGASPGSADGAAPDAPVVGPSAVACLLPFLVLTGVMILTSAFRSGFDFLYPLRVVAVGFTLWRLRRHFPVPATPPMFSAESVGVGAVVFVLWMILAPGSESATLEKLTAMDPTRLGEPWTTIWLLFRVAGSTITVPIAEELAFRGFLARRCIDDDVERVPVGAFTWPSFVASSVAFGLLHGQAWIAGTMAGMAFAWVLYRRRRLADAVAAHATTNALLSTWVVATGSWTEWG